MRWFWLLVGATTMMACSTEERCQVVEEVGDGVVGEVDLDLQQDQWGLDGDWVTGSIRLGNFEWQDGGWKEHSIADRNGCPESDEVYYTRWARGDVTFFDFGASQILVSVDPELEGQWAWQASPIIIVDAEELFQFWQEKLHPNAPDTEEVEYGQLTVGGASYPDGTEVFGYNLKIVTDINDHVITGEGATAAPEEGAEE